MESGTRHSNQPLLSVVIVSFNGSDHIEECLESLRASSPLDTTEICVADNASSDDTVAIVEQFAATCPNVKVIRSDRNLGYAGGVNFALPHVTGRYVAVLNQDMVVEEDWLTQSVELLESDRGIGAVSPMMALYSNPQRINSIGQNVHVTGLGFNRWLGRPRELAGEAPFPVSGIHGGAFLIRRSILDHIGGWDASGFLYHEDVELSWLLHLLGYKIYCAPAKGVQHKYHLTMHPDKLFLLERNRWHMLCCNLSPLSFVLLLPFFICTEALMWGFCILRGPKFVRAKLRAYLHTSRTGQVIRDRRAWIRSIRKRTDWQVLRCLKWRYAWDQFATLGKERGAEVQR